MTQFQRINLSIGLAALALVACMAISQSQPRLTAEAETGTAYGTR